MSKQQVDAARVGHTPGPWSIAPSSNPGNGTGWRDIVSNGGEYARSSPSYVGEALERDARLIAAAPDLLAALKIAKHYADCCDMETADEKCREDLAVINAAIARAEGRYHA